MEGRRAVEDSHFDGDVTLALSNVTQWQGLHYVLWMVFTSSTTSAAKNRSSIRSPLMPYTQCSVSDDGEAGVHCVWGWTFDGPKWTARDTAAHHVTKHRQDE